VLQSINGVPWNTTKEEYMGLWNRYRTIKSAEKKKAESQDAPVDVSELDDDTIDAGDALEKEVAEELERSRTRRRSAD
tara:strand:+ start:75 stop:308 length:234 start_codon:yes stop_codon:yes gene_type:complete